MARITASVIGADGTARQIAQLEREIGDLVDEARDELGEVAELAFAAHALKGRSGRLARGITSETEGDAVVVRAEARNPQTGFDYVAVTRFGHRKALITPRADRSSASVIATRGRRAKGRAATLRFSIGGKVLYRRSVKGFRPKGDWAERAMPQIEMQAEAVAARLSRRIEEAL